MNVRDVVNGFSYFCACFGKGLFLLAVEVLKDMGIACIVANSKKDFLRQLFEKKMRYTGLVVVKSKYSFRIFYINTNKILFSSEISE